MSEQAKVAMRCSNPTCSLHDIKVNVPEDTECIGCQQALVHVIDPDLISRLFGTDVSDDVLKKMGFG